MKKSTNIRRIGTLLLSCLLVLQLFVPALAAETEVIYIRSAQDLVALAEHCKLDSWSRGKTVILQKDISLSGVDFSTIPTFGGTFDGGGHTINGWTLTDSCAPGGLFSLLQAGGEIRDLRVEGTVAPNGSATAIGGIVGENSGTITGCSFAGNIVGDTAVGGIAGRNTVTGTVSSCRVQGGVFGETMTGGVVGENHGTVSGCSNVAYINTQAQDPSIEVSDLDVTNRRNLLTPGNLYHVATDTGGVAGFSDGMLLNCINGGSVGYQHVGYNVGGIAGRSRGFVSGCENRGEICGRKEVGGIVGQAEPYVVSTLSRVSLDSVRAELKTLNRLVDRATRDAEDSSHAISSCLTDLNQDVSGASDDVKALGDALTGYADDTVSEINRGGDIVDHVADQMSDIADQLPAMNQKIEKTLDRIDDAMGHLEKAGTAGSDAMEDLKLAAEDLKEASRLLDAAMEQISEGIATVDGAVTVNDHGIQSVNWTEVKNGLTQIADGMKILANGDAAGSQHGVAVLVRSAMEHLQDGLDDLSGLTAQMKEAATDVRAAMNTLQGAANDVTDVLDDLADLADYLDGVDPLQFQSVSSRTSQASDRLHNTVQDMSNQLELLNQEISSASDRLLADIRDINNQFMVVMDLLLDEANAVEDRVTGDRIMDTSDKDLNAVTYGKLFRCTNNGTVYGDFDVGGVAGSMGIYNELDPEGDGVNHLSDSVRKQYELKAVLQSCTNAGGVTAKRNYVGSICGLAKLGVITDCEAYGSATSEGGDYVGGLAGGCSTIVRSSYAKCTLSGDQYIGGIVGSVLEESSDTALISNCVALVEIPEAAQYAGSIAGWDAGTFRGNRFVSDTLAGIDRMSFTGRAEPISYETLLQQAGLPSAFRKFTLTFQADGRSVETVLFDYGESFDDSVLPEIPKKDGMYGKWDREELKDLRFDTVVTAEYFPSITALASDAKREDGRVVFLVEGQFSDRDSVNAVPAILSFDAAPTGVWETLRSYNRELLEQWQLTFPSDGSESNTVRYLSPNGKTDHLHIYLLEDGKWQELPCDSVGTYLTFQLPAGRAVITVLQASTTWWIWLVIGIFLLVMLLLVVQHHWLSRLYKRAATRVAQREAAVAALPAKRRKLRNLLLTLAVLMALLCITVGAIVHFAPGVKNGVELYRMLNSYELRDDLDMELSMDVTVNGKTYTSTMPLYITTTSEKRVSCINFRGIPLYFTSGHLLLENGTAYTAEGLFPDGEELLHRSVALFQALHIASSGTGGDKTYRVTAEAAAADELLSMLLSGQAAESSGMDVELVTQSGQPTLLHFLWEGNTVDGAPAALDAELHLDVPQQEEHRLPLEVSTAAAGTFEDAVDLTDDVREVLLAVTNLAQRDPMEADLNLAANCGPLLLNETVRLQYTVESGKDLIRLTRGGLTLFLAEGSLCSADGQSTTSTLSGTGELLPVLYQAVLSGDAERLRMNGKSVYTLSLDDESMEALVTAMTPDAKAMNLMFASGSLKAEIADGKLQTLTAQCSGTAKIALADVPAAFTVQAKFSEDQTAFPTPDSVVQALGLLEE